MLNGNAALVTVGSLDQSANFTQYNTVFSQIVISDTGATDAADRYSGRDQQPEPRLGQCELSSKTTTATATLINR